VTDLQGLVANDDPFDEQLQDGLLVDDSGRGKAALDVGAEGGEILEHDQGVGTLLTQAILLLLLRQHRLPALSDHLAALRQFLQADHLRLVRIEQPPILALDPRQAGRQVAGGGLRREIPLLGQLRVLRELRQEGGGVTEQLDHMLPHRRLEVLGFDNAARTAVLAGAHDRVFAVALVVAALRLGGRGFVADAEHGQAADATGQQTPQ
jgi:hypothetical protein